MSTNFDLKWFRKFYSLPTLDERLKAPRDQAKLKAVIARASEESRWKTLEFKIYACIFIVVVPLMFKQGIDVSKSSHPNYEKYSHILSDGWIFGRKVDNSDTQYRFFRDSFFLLCGLMSLHVICKRIVCGLTQSATKLQFDMWFGLLFLCLAHGFNALKILFHVCICYYMVSVLLQKDKESGNKESKVYKYSAVTLLWVYGISALYFNDKYRDAKTFAALGLPFCDEVKGLIPRWDVFYNFTLLRTISFNMDWISRFFALKEMSVGNRIQMREVSRNLDSQRSLHDISDSLTPLAPDLSDKDRMSYPWAISNYDFKNYLSYVFYTPLFIAGPVITFNDYLYQTRQTLTSISMKRNAVYAIRFIICLLTLEFILHYMYVVAIAKFRIYENYTPFQLSMIGLFNLNVIWLKLLIPWRFFRLWALLDNIDPPENMIRCVNNNYSAMAFWRAWHRSFNKWVTKYIYIPLGGSNNRILTSLAVFSFVAIWHDIEFKLLVWGWLIVLFLLPEIFLSSFFKQFSNEPWYRHVCAVGSVVNIWLMMIANLYGFCMGHDGTIGLLKSMFQTFQGGIFLIVSSACLFVGVQIMYELRESEKRHGVDVRC